MQMRCCCLSVLLLSFVAARAGAPVVSGDAYVRFDAATTSWTCGTQLIEQRLELAGGKFRLAALRNKLTGTEYTAGADSDEFRFVFGAAEASGTSGGYQLKDYEVTLLPVPKASPGIDPGLALVIRLEHPLFEIDLHYDIYASTPRTPLGMIRKWYRVTNRTAATQPLTQISMNRLRLREELPPRLQLHYWQGGGAWKGTNEMRVEQIDKQTNRTFDSLASAPGFRADDIYDGSASLHPYFVLNDPKAGEGLFIGFNYLGPWSARFWNRNLTPMGKAQLLVTSQLELHTEPLAPGGSFDAPNSFIGVYKGDLDNAGEQLQDWQATFKWDYTREQYLWGAAIYNGHWDDPKHMRRTDLHTQEMWRIADLCRRIGATVAHEDDFWFDQRDRGVWEGIEWGELVRYLRQSGIHFRLWMPPQHFAAGTPPDTEHPDWEPVPKQADGVSGWYGLGFCSAAQGAHDYMRRFMLDREKRYGTFYWRLDGWIETPCYATNHGHPPGQPHVQQYRHYLQMLREVKDANPEMGIQGCNSGGEWANWDKFELIENNQGSDGGGPDDRYYLSYFWPVAKMMDLGGGSTMSDARLAHLTQSIVVDRYLRQQGVIGRFMRVYHPRADGAPDAHTYFQVTNSQRDKAAIFQDKLPKGEVVVYPKALEPETRYSVAFLFGKETRAALGADIMREGIRFQPKDAREVILLNLDGTPGRGTDHTPPEAPAKVSAQVETWGGRSGIALRWQPSTDNVLVAAYEVFRDGKLLDRVGIGTFYFDAGAGAGHHYEIRAVDGDGNRSPSVPAAL